MSQSWYYLAGDQAIGPLSPEQVRAAVSAGLIRAETKIRVGESGKWYLASQVSGLLPATPPAAPKLPPTPPAVRVAPPAAAVSPLPASGAPAPTRAAAAPRVVQPVAAAPTSALEDIATNHSYTRRPKRRSGLVGKIIMGLGVGLALAVAGGVVWIVIQSGGSQTATATAVSNRPSEDPEAKERRKPKAAPKKKDPRDDLSFGPQAFDPNATVTISLKADPRVFESDADLTPECEIDRIVFGRLKELGIKPSKLCSDGVFLRRAYVDIIGTIPTAEEARQFLEDNSSNKRQVLIDRLLARDEFNDYWTMKWCDILRIKAEFPINLWPNAAQAYHRWVRTCIRNNVPYDKMAREMLTTCGSNFRVPQVNFYRALQSKTPVPIAKTVALTFMGVRAEKWPEERLNGMAGFFSQLGFKRTAEWKEEIVYFDPDKKSAALGKPVAPGAASPTAAAVALKPVFPDGTSVTIPPGKDPREVFADWLIDGKNPWFAPSLVNRVWSWLVGRGIVHEPDDFRDDNPPSNPELLNWLAADFVKSKYDMKHLYRVILNSKTYQLSPISTSTDPKAQANFAHYSMRRLEAEVLIDALNQLTGTTESYSSPIPEPFTWVPETVRAIALPDGSITSAFLELFGRPPRDTGVESERINRMNPAQRLHMLNSTHVRAKFERGPVFQKLVNAHSGSQEELVEALFLTILGRFPTKEEVDVIRYYPASDIAWVLINEDEFLFHH